jgi:hypothetical protein
MKLAQHQKNQIRSKVVAEKFDPLFVDLITKKQAFAASLIASDAGTILGSPVEWFPRIESVLCRFNGMGEWLSLPEPVHVPYYVCGKGKYYDIESYEYKLWHALNSQQEELELRRKELRAEINAVLKAISTDKKLEEVWPEALKYLDRAPNLPATTDVSRLKDLLAK